MRGRYRTQKQKEIDLYRSLYSREGLHSLKSNSGTTRNTKQDLRRKIFPVVNGTYVRSTPDPKYGIYASLNLPYFYYEEHPPLLR